MDDTRKQGERVMTLQGLVKRPWAERFLVAVRLGLGCLFLWSSIPKIRQPYDFLGSVYSYEIVGPKLGVLVAIMLPWLELFAGICLVGGILVGGAFLLCVGMAGVFTFAIASALYRDLEISCGCFSASGGDAISYSTLIRAVVILVLSVMAYSCVMVRRPATGIGGSRRRGSFES